MAGPPVAITLLGGFAVTVDGRAVDPSHWRRRPAANLVKLLALAPDRRLHREQVIDALWPDVAVADAAPRLHKAAHFARRALGPDAIAVDRRRGAAAPRARRWRSIVVDFETAATAALDARRPASTPRSPATAASCCPTTATSRGPRTRRQHVAHLHRQLLRAAGRWSELLAVDPTDEAAHVGADRGPRRRAATVAAALAQFDRLAAILDAELGVRPGPDAVAAQAAALDLPTGHGRGRRRRRCRPRRSGSATPPTALRLAYALRRVRAARW